MDEQIIKLYTAQQEAISLLTQQLIGLNAAHQIIIELLLSQSPQQKSAVSLGLSQILAHPERVQNQYCLKILKEIQGVVKSPSRTTPEGRREWMSVVPQSDSNKHD